MLARRAALAGALILAVATAGCGTKRQMPHPTGMGPALHTLVFYDQGAEPTPTTNVQPLVAANRAAIAALAPDWYKVMPDGSLRDLSTNALKTFATTEHIQLTPLVVNYQGTSSFLMNAKARTRAVDALATMLSHQPSYTGLNIDFELLKPQARLGLTLFMEALYGKVTALHKTLTIDIIPAGTRRAAGHQAYSYAKLAHAATDVVLMTYDAHDSGSKPGPIAPLRWVRTRVNLALDLGIPANRLIVGLADYGYDWPAASTKAATLSLAQVQSLIQTHHAKVLRNGDGTPHFTYTAGGVRHTVFYEDGKAIRPIIRFARTKRVAGLALWMAGYENAAYWTALRVAAGTGPAAKTSTTTPVAPKSGTTTKTTRKGSTPKPKASSGKPKAKASPTASAKKSSTTSKAKVSGSSAAKVPSGSKAS